jgi:hypothetical protein
LFWPSLQELREKYSDRYNLSMQNTNSQPCDINWLVFWALADKIQAEFAVFELIAGLRN